MKKSFVAAAFLVLFFAACKKEDAPHNTSTVGPYTTLAKVYSDLAPLARTSSIIVSSGGSIYANGGTRVIIPANAFMSATGANITGSVDVTVNDWLQRGDMIFGKVLPISNNQSLESGGQAFVSVSQSGKPVFLKVGKQVQMNLPQFGKTVPGMTLFVGNQVEDVVNNVQWRPLDTGFSGRLIYNGDTLTIFSDSLRYCNADKFMSSPNYQTFTVKTTSDVGDFSGLMAYALYDNYKGLWLIGNLSNGSDNASHIPNIPVHLVVFGLNNGNFYGGILGITPSNGVTYTVPLTKTDPAAFKQLLNQL